MSYVDDVCNALVRVLDHAAVHEDVRLAGYAANLDFHDDGDLSHYIESAADD